MNKEALSKRLSEYPFLKHPVFIAGSGRSGTTLLWQLLNDHPAILSWPFEFPIYSDYALAIKRLKNKPKTIAAINDIIFTENTLGFSEIGKHYHDDFIDYPLDMIDRDRFFDFFEPINNLEVDRKTYIQTLILAYYEALHEKPENPTYIVIKSNEYYMSNMVADFPDYHLINMMREPIATYISKKKYQFKINKQHPALTYHRHETNIPKLLSHAKSILQPQSCLMLVNAAKIIASRRFAQNFPLSNNIMHLNLEDLQQDPYFWTHKIADFLQIPFQDSLLTPSIYGQIAQANTPEKATTEGKVYQPESSQRAEGMLSYFELHWLESIFAKEGIIFQSQQRNELRWWKKLTTFFVPLPHEFTIFGTKPTFSAFLKGLCVIPYALFSYLKFRLLLLRFRSKRSFDKLVGAFFP